MMRLKRLRRRRRGLMVRGAGAAVRLRRLARAELAAAAGHRRAAGPGSFTIQAQMPDVNNIQPNSRVRVGDVNVGNVTKIERQGWHALVTMRLNGDVDLPANATAKLGQTSLLGSLHIELAPPTDAPPRGQAARRLADPAGVGGAYPSTEQTLAAMSLLLNGGGIGQIQDITEAFSTAFGGRENDLRSLIEQLDKFIGYLNDQTGRHHRRHREPEPSGRSVRRAETRRGQGVRDHPGRAGGAQGSARQPRPTRWRSSASSARWPPTRSTRPRKRWSRSSKTSARCWSRSPTPARR